MTAQAAWQDVAPIDYDTEADDLAFEQQKQTILGQCEATDQQLDHAIDKLQSLADAAAELLSDSVSAYAAITRVPKYDTELGDAWGHYELAELGIHPQVAHWIRDASDGLNQIVAGADSARVALERRKDKLAQDLATAKQEWETRP